MNGKLTNEQKSEIVQKYQTGKYNCADLGRQYLVSSNAIRYILKKLGIGIIRNTSHSHRIHSLNENYFDKIDTEEKAYFLGFLYADGCNYQKRNSIILSLNIIDLEILEKFKQLVETDKPISFNKNNMCTLYMNGIHISKQLTKLGCIPKKSLILKFPTEEQVPSHLIRHFIRGYFDGDGSIYTIANKETNLSIVSTLEFCNSVLEIFKNCIDMQGGNVYHAGRSKQSKTNTREIRIGGNRQVEKVLDFLYKSATIYLNRKYLKYKLFKESRNI